jgi:hypothetical protein
MRRVGKILQAALKQIHRRQQGAVAEHAGDDQTFQP